MLVKLRVSNYTLMKRAEVPFRPGLNVITGETGVGKSLLLGAVAALLGERRTGLPVRAGCDKAVLEAEFDSADNSEIRQWLTRHHLPDDFPLILRREFYSGGKTRFFINDTPANLTLARELGVRLLDLHGQHEVVTLFDRNRQLRLLDAFLNRSDLLDRYRELYHNLQKDRKELTRLRRRLEDESAGSEALRLQKKELDSLNPLPGEIEAIEEQLRRLENSEKIYLICNEICERLNEGDRSAVENLNEILRRLPDLYPYNASLSSWEDDLSNFRSALAELNRNLQDFSREVKFDPLQVEELRQRHAALTGFLKRWGHADRRFDDVIEEIDRGQAALDDLRRQAQALEEKIREGEKTLLSVGETITGERRRAARKLTGMVQDHLSAIGMGKARFSVHFDPPAEDKPYPDGLDRIDYRFSPNGKLAYQSLRRVASGGEMSRIMLALKSALAEADRTETLIFDEIDQGISGRVAHLVGLQLRQLARFHQVVVVTHLPQIASLADLHLSVRKTGDDSATVVPLESRTQRIEEVAALLTASGITEGALLNAREMVEAADKFKTEIPTISGDG